MQLGRMLHQDLDLGMHQRPDGQQFKVTARLYEMPATYDYWHATYDAEHDQWGHMRFVLTVPKKIAVTVDFAQVLVSGAVLDQVKSALQGASAKGRDLAPCFASDGWVLI